MSRAFLVTSLTFLFIFHIAAGQRGFYLTNSIGLVKPFLESKGTFLSTGDYTRSYKGILHYGFNERWGVGAGAQYHSLGIVGIQVFDSWQLLLSGSYRVPIGEQVRLIHTFGASYSEDRLTSGGNYMYNNVTKDSVYDGVRNPGIYYSMSWEFRALKIGFLTLEAGLNLSLRRVSFWRYTTQDAPVYYYRERYLFCFLGYKLPLSWREYTNKRRRERGGAKFRYK